MNASTARHTSDLDASARAAASERVRTAPKLGELRVIALLNGNARSVTPATLARFERLLPGNVIATESLAHARLLLDACIDHDIDLVLSGGGDGTFVETAQTLRACMEARGLEAQQGPRLGILPMGTGNALASYLDLGTAWDEAAWIASGGPQRMHTLRGLELSASGRSRTTLSPFVGLGLDAQLLADFHALKHSARDTPWAKLASGLPGYVYACATRTFPTLLDPRRKPARMAIVNNGTTAYRLDASGERVAAIPPGGLIYEGPLVLAAASTVTTCGFDLRLFPFSDLDPDRFHLRVFDGSPLAPLPHLPKLFKGTYTTKHFHDVLADSVHIHLDRPAPLQIAGDVQGNHRDIQFKLAPWKMHVAAADRSRLH